MGIAIFGNCDGKDFYHYVAFRDVFEFAWLPVGERLGLGWISLIRRGFNITVENYDEVVGEVEKLIETLECDPMLKIYPLPIARAKVLLELLHEYTPCCCEYVFLGD
jgi:hypothetical protein